MILFDAQTCGFYDTDLHERHQIPRDSVEISRGQYEAVMAGQTAGKRIIAGQDGYPALADPAPPSKEMILVRLKGEVQQMLDSEAQSAGYGGILDAVSYSNEPLIGKFYDEGRAFSAWRSRVWEAFGIISKDVLAGERVAPTERQLISELPKVKN